MISPPRTLKEDTGLSYLPFSRAGLSVVVGISLGCAASTAWADEGAWPSGSLSPSGYTGAINVPTADVLPWGGAGIGLTNNNPEIRRSIHAGGFGSLNAGLGLLPGLEVVARLAFEGDLQCSTYDRPACQGGQRDLSVGAKYQLPLELPWGTRLALGFTDYGGAATTYRQIYGVATSTWGPVDMSLGYGRPKSRLALLDGPFGSAYLRVSDHWAGVVEYDSRTWRAGAQYRQPLGKSAQLEFGVSRALNDPAMLQRWQWTAALHIMLGKPEEALRPATAGYLQAETTALPQQPAVQPAIPSRSSLAVATASSQAQATATAVAQRPTAAPTLANPPALVQQLQAKGFAHIEVRYWPADAQHSQALWVVQAEPRRWRQSQLDGAGAALASWLQQVGTASTDEVAVTLTYQKIPALHVRTSANCLARWLGHDVGCEQAALPVAMRRVQAGASLPVVQRQSAPLVATGANNAAWAPQIEVGPSLRTTVGTEFGLADYSLALEMGAEVHLAKGLFWQGTYQIPIAHSGDFSDGHVFASNRHPAASFDMAMLSYIHPLSRGVATQLNAGYINRRYLGAQLDASWLPGDGRWRIAGTLGRYRHETTHIARTPVMLETQYNLVPGLWNLEAVVGRFLGGDKGYRLASSHWFGDRQVQLFYRSSQGEAGSLLGQRVKALGVTLTLPLGSKEALALGSGTTVRGTDRWNWGLQTKVGGTDNALLYGYGEMPRVRHGLLTDLSDNGRNSDMDLQARLPSLRRVVQEQWRNEKADK
ncbi:YjbH domain-containing protein [Alicycliphilus denitrificans]|uniref:YjbH domain-containing protein n=1 Tax=Alicycliphilus denitrificans TaxID=179636 RepID=UPI00384BB578